MFLKHLNKGRKNAQSTIIWRGSLDAQWEKEHNAKELMEHPGCIKKKQAPMVHNTKVKSTKAKKEQAKKWSNIPSETKTKVINKWEEKAKKT